MPSWDWYDVFLGPPSAPSTGTLPAATFGGATTVPSVTPGIGSADDDYDSVLTVPTFNIPSFTTAPAASNPTTTNANAVQAVTPTPLTVLPGTTGAGSVSTAFGPTLGFTGLTSAPTVTAVANKPAATSGTTPGTVGGDIVDQVAKFLGVGTGGTTANVVTIAPVQNTTNSYSNTSSTVTNPNPDKLLEGLNVFAANQSSAQIVATQQQAGFFSRVLDSMDGLITKITGSQQPIRGDDGAALGTLNRPGSWGYQMIQDQANPTSPSGTVATITGGDANVSTIGGVKFNWAMVGALAAAVSVLIYLLRRK